MFYERKINKVILALAVMLPFVGFAQSSDLGNWAIYFGNKKINDKWNIHHEIQYRNYNAVGDLEQLLLRAGVGYNLSENNNNLLLGYGYIHSQNYINADDKVKVNEHRIYQQFITKQNFGRFNLQHRYRFEQRWVEDVFKMRFRYFLALAVPLNNNVMTDKTIYLAAYNEIFINTKDNVFDRNRLYGGIGYRLNKSVRFELGYMNQYLNGGNRDQLNIITGVSF